LQDGIFKYGLAYYFSFFSCSASKMVWGCEGEKFVRCFLVPNSGRRNFFGNMSCRWPKGNQVNIPEPKSSDTDLFALEEFRGFRFPKWNLVFSWFLLGAGVLLLWGLIGRWQHN